MDKIGPILTSVGTLLVAIGTFIVLLRTSGLIGALAMGPEGKGSIGPEEKDKPEEKKD